MPIMGTFAIACNILQGMQELIESHVTLSIQAFVGLLHKNASWENVAGGLLLDPDKAHVPCRPSTPLHCSLQFDIIRRSVVHFAVQIQAYLAEAVVQTSSNLYKCNELQFAL